MENLNQAYKALFSSELGKTVLDDLCATARIYSPLPFENVERAEGARQIVLYILNKVYQKDVPVSEDIEAMRKIIGDFYDR